MNTLIKDKTSISFMTNNSAPNTSTSSNVDNSDKTILSPAPSQSLNNETVIKQTPTDSSQKIDNGITEQKPVGTGSLLKNRFDLLESVGSGGMGTVYKSLDRRDIEAGNSSFIAIKIINDEFKNDIDLLKALHSETRKTQELAHPNIITVYDFDRDEDTIFMTMEFIDGAPLNQVIKSNSQGLPLSQALGIISKMAQALLYAHSKNIIHLDFKPSNVLMDQKNHVKVFDFGIARLANSALSRGFDASVLGGLTPSYASLEMFKNKVPDPRDDIYALACVSYELLTGQHPFNKVSADIAQKRQLKPKKIKSLNSKQWNTLKQALAFDRKDRTKDIDLFLQGMMSTTKTPYLILSAVVISIAIGLFILNPFQSESNSQAVIPETNSHPTGLSPQPNQTLIKAPIIGNNKPQSIIKELGNINLWSDSSQYQIGETLQFSFSVDTAMYIKIVSINSQGERITLFPNPFQMESYCEPSTTYQVPPEGAEFTLDIGEPKGQDRIIAIGSSTPIPDQSLLFGPNDELLIPSLIYQSFTYTIN